MHYVPSLLVITLPPQGDVYNFILDVEGYPAQIFALAVSVGLLVLRRRHAELERPFKAWLPAVWLRIIVCVALLAAPFFPPPDGRGDVGFFYATYALVGIGMCVSAPPVAFCYCDCDSGLWANVGTDLFLRWCTGISGRFSCLDGAATLWKRRRRCLMMERALQSWYGRISCDWKFFSIFIFYFFSW